MPLLLPSRSASRWLGVMEPAPYPLASRIRDGLSVAVACSRPPW
ncbi:hypothetical protein [Falsiroseomonas selenitidurans]|nr:hypothetical protein [Falsiroseomonas selenitidurans]